MGGARKKRRHQSAPNTADWMRVLALAIIIDGMEEAAYFEFRSA